MPLVMRQRSHWRITGTVSVAGTLVALPYWYSGAVAPPRGKAGMGVGAEGCAITSVSSQPPPNLPPSRGEGLGAEAGAVCRPCLASSLTRPPPVPPAAVAAARSASPR
jgi:hypothetical protein